MRGILEALGLDLRAPEFRDTPRRVARMLVDEIFHGLARGRAPRLTVFPNVEGYRSMVVVRDVPFYSMCAHHFVPFFGVGHVAYIPRDRVVGLSKIARVLDHFAARPQVQERLTEEVANLLVERLRPLGVMVVLEARHLCMEMRGVEKPGALTTTAAVRGVFAKSLETREEFLRHISRARRFE